MFNRILIANRGEIACRIIDSCAKLDVETVAVFSDADAGARHVACADRAMRIGPAPVGESYLRGDRIIAAALEAGAEAIHPGYGFLSENADFAEAVAQAGLTFIGPSPDAVRAMGLKGEAKARAEAAGVPVVPGYHGHDQSDARLAREAESIGYPLMIKAVAGGGGRGMRLVERQEDFAAALAAARSEATAGFGNGDVLLERYIAQPRHIEVQIFGDGTRAVHLFERDCSLQRRHQKVIEEAPAPGMPAPLRAAMGQAAVRLAEATGYRGAGTVEFIVDGSGPLREDGFWFMEMNTRLQVEHPVTEAVTGVDLVAWQLQVAAGGALPLEQEALSLTGHAFEARVYAEDVPAGFLPATGRLSHVRFPAGAEARVDTGVREGDAITPHYDPMIAKLTVHGPDRTTALQALQRALGAVELAGCTTNLAFLRALAADADFGRGAVDTGLIARAGTRLTDPPVPCHRTRSLAALASLGLHESAASGFTLWQPLRHGARLVWRGEEILATAIVTGPGRFSVEVAGEVTEITRRDAGWQMGDSLVPARIAQCAGEITVFWGNTYTFTVPDPLARGSAAGAGTGAIVAPMPGRVLDVAVAVGDTVQEGAPLVVLEAMKMEHVMRAEASGVVAAVDVQPGQQVEAGALLVRVE